MSIRQHPMLVALVATLSTLHAPMAWAVRDGIPVSPATVLPNPFAPQKSVDAWKLVGSGSCSNIRISREWVMAAAHCPYGDNRNTFSNEFGSAKVDLTTCAEPAYFGAAVVDPGPGRINDFHICRLVDTGTLPEPSSYPVLAVMPAFNAANASHLGALLVRGMALLPGDPNQVGLVDFNSVRLNADPTTLDRTRYQPYVVNGDSGGGAYWLPPNGQDAALVGIVSQVNPGGLANVPWYFTADNLTKIVAHIKSHGQATDQVPVIKTTPDAYFSLTGAVNVPAPMASAPTLALTSPASNAGITATWMAPSSTTKIDRYRVTLAQDGVTTQTAWVAAGQAPTFSFSGLKASATNRVCVVPSNDGSGLAPSVFGIQSGTSAADMYATTKLLGCTDFDNRPPAAVANLAGTVISRTSSSANVSMTWSAQSSLIQSYRVTQTTSFVSGPKRVVTKDISTPGLITSVAKGTTLCTQVWALSALKVQSPPSPNVCLTVN